MPIVINGTGTVTGATAITGVPVSGPAFSVFQSVAQSIGAADAILTMDSEEFDTASMYASNRFTPTISGYYFFAGNCQMSITTVLYTVLYKNGGPWKYGTYVPTSAAGPISHVTCLAFMNGTTDYMELRASSSVTGNTSAGQARTSFSGFLVRLP
jgi:hypothetical protein